MKIEKISKEIYDGEGEGFYKSGITIKIGSSHLNFTYDEMNKFIQLKDLIGQSFFQRVLHNINGQRKEPFEAYASKKGLSLAYIVKNDDLILISYREHQPGRYKVFLEGIISNHNEG